MREETRENWGYGVWLTLGVLIAVPEIMGAAWSGSWFPTISGTVGDLEYHHTWVALIAVGAIVCAVYGAIRFAPDDGEGKKDQQDEEEQDDQTPTILGEVAAGFYFFLSLIAIAGGTAIAAVVTGGFDRFAVGRTLYGLTALLWIVVPSLCAWRIKWTPFPTLFSLVRSLERKFKPLAYLVVAGLAVLVIHLAFYPWPEVIPDLQRLHKVYRCHPAGKPPLNTPECVQLEIRPEPSSP
jgi:hypothetical protein